MSKKTLLQKPKELNIPRRNLISREELEKVAGSISPRYAKNV